MRVGIPKGLMYPVYGPFIRRYFEELGAEISISSDTNRRTLDEGVRYCVDDACIPVKIFHGHVAELRDSCDMIVVPRIMSIEDKEFICPKFCGLPEMITSSIPKMPRITTKPLCFNSRRLTLEWCMDAAKPITTNKKRINSAFQAALQEQAEHRIGIHNTGCRRRIALAGHPYNIYDEFLNMNIVKKLNKVGIGVCTEETVDNESICSMSNELYKKPFWTFARRNYGFATHMALSRQVDGIIYLSSFACGIDSVVVELLRSKLPDFPMLVVKLDEHSGEAGFDTRLEAYSDMILREA